MYHTIEFCTAWTVDLEVSANQPLEKLRVRKGTQLKAQVKPYVIESTNGPIEVADLFLEDGTTARLLPFELFFFVNQK
jgi:hypothetical protein